MRKIIPMQSLIAKCPGLLIPTAQAILDKKQGGCVKVFMHLQW